MTWTFGPTLEVHRYSDGKVVVLVLEKRDGDADIRELVHVSIKDNEILQRSGEWVR